MIETMKIQYNGATIYSGSQENTVTLPTDGMYMADNVMVVLAEYEPSPVLNDNEWSVISAAARAGKGGNYWAVGDTKSVTLTGTVGTLSLDTTLWVYIIGINHRGVQGITFQGFKTGQTSGVSVCLVDGEYGVGSRTGSRRFNMNHWGGSSSPYNTNYGGWKGCDARYDILGSTNVRPSGYGSTPTTSRVGYDAQPATTTSPVSKTLMSCLPSDLRTVMQPMTIYTDNKGNSSNTAANVTASVDYLPLLAEFEIFGARTYANQYEQNNQVQYAYYSAGNSKIKHKQSGAGASVIWWERSTLYTDSRGFCVVEDDGDASSRVSMNSYGLSPAFMV